MNKPLLTACLMLISISGFAQTEKLFEENPEHLAKAVVENSNSLLLTTMKVNLADGTKGGIDFKHMTEAEQFLYQDNLIDSVLRSKSHYLKDVYNKLCSKKNHAPTTLEYEYVNFGDIAYKIIEKGKNKGRTDSTILVVPVSFQTHSIAKDNVSDVKYDVDLTWEVKVSPKLKVVKENGRRAGTIAGYVPGNVKLVGARAKSINYLTSDKLRMKETVIDAIMQWYADLPQNLDREYVSQSIKTIEGMSVSRDDIKFRLPESQKLTVDNVPSILIHIDPYQYIDEADKNLYTDPSAYMIIAPTFNVRVDDSFKKADMKVTYNIKSIQKPIPDQEKEYRHSEAEKVYSQLAALISEYVETRDENAREAFSNIFQSPESEVEVSYISNKGNEKIKKESVEKYLSRLKGTSIEMSAAEFILVHPNWESIVYVVNQRYQSKRYSDLTQKQIHMNFDTDKRTYLVEKVEVVPNSTRNK